MQMPVDDRHFVLPDVTGGVPFVATGEMCRVPRNVPRNVPRGLFSVTFGCAAEGHCLVDIYCLFIIVLLKYADSMLL